MKKLHISYFDCPNCTWQSYIRPPYCKCPDCNTVVLNIPANTTLKEQNKPETSITKISEVDAYHVEAMLRYPVPFTPERIAFINGAKFQSTHMYTAEDCAKMLEDLRQRCAEEAVKAEYTEAAKWIIESVEYKDLLK